MSASRTLAALLALAPLAGGAAEPGEHRTRLHVSEGCTVEKGPNDRVSKGAPLVVEEDGRADDVLALGGDVTVKRGAVVRKAVAVGGSVRVETGATVREDAVALGGDVRVAKGARVGKDALALGGRLEVQPGAEVGGSRVGLDVTLGDLDLEKKLLEELRAEDCRIEPER
jgi:NDP-sugar pyrophosphorylase family protein